MGTSNFLIDQYSLITKLYVKHNSCLFYLITNITINQAFHPIREYNVAEPEHLFKAFDDAATENGALTAYNGITIDKYFKTWSEKAGHPLLTVVVNHQTGRMTVTQVNFTVVKVSLLKGIITSGKAQFRTHIDETSGKLTKKTIIAINSHDFIDKYFNI